MSLPSDHWRRSRNRLGRDTVIAQFIRFTGRSQSSPGAALQNQYAEPVQVYVKTQPVNRNLENFKGLDLTKNYILIWAAGAEGIGVRSGGDRFLIDGRVWQIEAIYQDWPAGSTSGSSNSFNESSMLCVDVTGSI